MSGADFILGWCKVSSYGQYYNVMTRVGLSCRMGQRRLPMRGRRLANYGFESWRMRGVSSLGTIRTTPYCYHKQPASALGFCDTVNVPERPQQNSRWQGVYRAQLARLESESRQLQSYQFERFRAPTAWRGQVPQAVLYGMRRRQPKIYPTTLCYQISP